MDQPSKEIRVRVEAPPIERVPLPELEPEGLSKLYYLLGVLTWMLSGLSVYLSLAA